jgi:hypothetical protein
MSIARLADKLLQRIVPTTEAGACVRDWCGCYPHRSSHIYCRNMYTSCRGLCNGTVWGTHCASTMPSC